MSANIDLQRKIAAFNVRKRWQREIQQLQGRLQGQLVINTNKSIKEGTPTNHMRGLGRFDDRDITEDKREIMRDIYRRQKALKNQSPVELDRKDRLKLERMMAKDREWLKKNMVSRRMNSLSPKHPDFNDAVTKCEKEHSDEFKSVANRYKNAMRQLEPNDPNAANIEKLRK